MDYRYLETPVGSLLLAGEGEQVHRIVFPRNGTAAPPESSWRQRADVLEEAARQLDAYFAGQRHDFDLDLSPRGTDFQRCVWQTLSTIPYGQTWTYAQLAAAIDRPTATRAVGAANGRNPLPIVLPCHRVIGSDGSLTGFGGGLDVKRFLLALEGAVPDTLF